MIKVFSSFLFARHNTKTPFHFSLFSVILNILVSIYFFPKIGFIIIPIATTFSSWINALLLFVYLINKKYFNFSSFFFKNLFKIFLTTILTLYSFYNLVELFKQELNYHSEYKLIYIILLVIITFAIYIIISMLTKAFKFSDINLKY